MSKYITADKAPLFLMNRTINKCSTGCGVTTMLIRDQFNRVIVNPNRAIVDGKSHENCFCVRGGISAKAVASYLKSLGSNPIKIMTTAASFSKVIEGFKLAFDNYYDIMSITALTIDESELSKTPLYAGSYAEVYATRHWWFAFNEVSATPLTNCDVTLSEFDYEFDYIHIPDLSLNRFAGDIQSLIDSNSEVFIFVNSVKTIKALLSKVSKNGQKIDTFDVNIYCGVGELNDTKLHPYETNTHHPNASITFSTSAAFRGVDMFANTSNPHILVYSGVGYTAIDWSILVQIAGRVRNVKTTPIVCGYLVNRSVEDLIADLIEARDLIEDLNKDSKVIPEHLEWATVKGTTLFNEWFLSSLIKDRDNIYNKSISRILGSRKNPTSIDLGLHTDNCFKSCFKKMYRRYTTRINNTPIDHILYSSTVLDKTLEDSIYGRIAIWCVDNNISETEVLTVFEKYNKKIKGVFNYLSKKGCTEDWCETDKGKAIGKAVHFKYREIATGDFYPSVKEYMAIKSISKPTAIKRLEKVDINA